MKKIIQITIQISLIFISYFITQLIVLGTKGLFPKSTNVNILLIYQLLILPLTWLWVNFFIRKMVVNKIIYNNFNHFFTKIIIAFAIVVVIQMLSLFYNYKFNNIDFSIYNNTYPKTKWLIFILMIFSLAFSEELIFRKLIVNLTLKLTENIYLIALINGILFSAIHIGSFINGEFLMIWAIGIVCIGFFNTIYVLKYKDLTFPTALHTFWNISTPLFIEGENYKIIDYVNYDNNEELICNTTIVIMSISLIACSIFFIYYNKIKSIKPL